MFACLSLSLPEEPIFHFTTNAFVFKRILADAHLAVMSYFYMYADVCASAGKAGCSVCFP